MGQIVHALIEHSLTPQEILEFPRKLEACPNNELAGKWDWSNPNFDVETLLKHWKTTQADFLAAHSWGDEDFPWLQKENLTLDFFTPNIIAFHGLFTWFFFAKDENWIKEFSQLTRAIGNLVKATDMLFVREITDDFVYTHETLTVDLFRQDSKTKYEAAIELR